MASAALVALAALALASQEMVGHGPAADAAECAAMGSLAQTIVSEPVDQGGTTNCVVLQPDEKLDATTSTIVTVVALIVVCGAAVWRVKDRNSGSDSAQPEPPPCRLPPVVSMLDASIVPCSWLRLFRSSSFMHEVCSVGAEKNAALLTSTLGTVTSRTVCRCAACKVQAATRGYSVAISCDNNSTEHLLLHLWVGPSPPPLCGDRQRFPWRTNGWWRESGLKGSTTSP